MIILCLKKDKEVLFDQIPEEHRDTFFGDPESVSNEDLAKVLVKIEKKKLTYKERLSPHGWRIVRMVMKENKLVDFVKMWRQNFVDTMKP